MGIWYEEERALGFTRLAINDKGSAGNQPMSFDNLVGAVNGEIYNSEDLSITYDCRHESHCDTHVVLPLFTKLGMDVLDVLDGFFSGVIVTKEDGPVYALRDHIGKKPLLQGRSGTEFFITSELKALDVVDWFEPVPLGISQLTQSSRKLSLVREHRFEDSEADLQELIRRAVMKRLPRGDEPVGIFLSGGLDSSIVTALASKVRKDIVYYTLADKHSPDAEYVAILSNYLDLKDIRYISPPSLQALPELIKKVVSATESYNPSIISNGLSTYLLAKAARADGLKVVLTGEGADELFCGYHYFKENERWQDTRSHLINDMYFTELRRIDHCTMAHSIEARCPFLDRAVRSYCDSLGYDDFYTRDNSGVCNKAILRRVFKDELPRQIIERRKTSFDVGSGVRKLVVSKLRSSDRSERAELKHIWESLFPFEADHPYFHVYPVFDPLIDKRGERH